MKKFKFLILTVSFCMASLSLFAAGKRKYLETSVNGFTKSSGDSFYLLSTSRLDVSESEKFEVPTSVKIYNKEGEQVQTRPNALTIGGNIFIVFASDGTTVKEIYEIPYSFEIGTYNGKGAKAAGFTPEEWTEEGYIVISLNSNSQSIEMMPFDSQETTVYNVYTANYNKGAKWYDENGNQVSSFNNTFLKSGSNKIRIKLRRVNGSPLVVEVRKLPPQYVAGGSSSATSGGTGSSNSSGSQSANNGQATANAQASSGTQAPAGNSSNSDAWDESAWDGWNGVANGVSFTVNTYTGRVYSFSERDRTLTITREDGKYKNFKVAKDAWIFDKNGKKGKSISAVGNNTKIRYMVRTQNGVEEIIDVRPIIINDDDEEEPVDYKKDLNLKDGFGYISSVKDKKKIVVIYDVDRAKAINFIIPDFVECYDMYGRECSLKDLGSTTKVNYKFVKEGNDYTIVIVREASE
ncbi:MAG: hypothetical protein J6Y60_09010 [Treponema sp.]|nr:hypothetical protein [Treponema sp.]